MKLRYFIYFIFWFLILSQKGNAREDSSRFSFLKRGTYFEQIILDPTESQTSAGLLKIWRSGTEDDGVYIPVNIGIQQSIVRYDFHKESGLELSFAGAVFTQFTIRKMEGNTYLGEMENADYKISLLLNYRIRKWSLRFRAFHKSSHLADDYLLRNNITEPNPGTLNYEQLDLTGSYQLNKVRLYAGFGYVITPNAVRERLSLQTGFLYRKSLNSKGNFRLIAGTDIKIFQQNEYAPNLRTGVGFEFGNAESTHAGFLIEYYNGHLPYSVLEYNKVNWFGFSIFLLKSRIK
jgi:hypothetical protein